MVEDGHYSTRAGRKRAKKIDEVSSVRLRQGIDRRMTSSRCMGNLLKPTEAADNVVGLRGAGGGGVTTTTTRLPPVPPYTRRRALTPHHHTITRNTTTTIKQPKTETDSQSVQTSLVFLARGLRSCVAHYLRHPTHHPRNNEAWADPVGGPRGRLHTTWLQQRCRATSLPCGMTTDESSCCLLARDAGSKLCTVCMLASLELSSSENGACDTRLWPS